MLRLALGDPNPGDELPYDLDRLQYDLASPDPEIADAALAHLTESLFMNVEDFTS